MLTNISQLSECKNSNSGWLFWNYGPLSLKLKFVDFVIFIVSQDSQLRWCVVVVHVVGILSVIQ